MTAPSYVTYIVLISCIGIVAVVLAGLRVAIVRAHFDAA
jgi:hypothetical protein